MLTSSVPITQFSAHTQHEFNEFRTLLISHGSENADQLAFEMVMYVRLRQAIFIIVNHEREVELGPEQASVLPGYYKPNDQELAWAKRTRHTFAVKYAENDEGLTEWLAEMRSLREMLGLPTG